MKLVISFGRILQEKSCFSVPKLCIILELILWNPCTTLKPFMTGHAMSFKGPLRHTYFDLRLFKELSVMFGTARFVCQKKDKFHL